MASMKIPAKARGFTLIELLITIAVASVLAAIAVPSFRSMMAGERISSESFDIMAMLTLTRSEAIKRNASVTSTPTNGNWKQGWVITSTFNGNPVTINRKEALSGSDIAIACFRAGLLQPACAPITFDPSGHLGPGTPVESIQILTNSRSAAGGENARCISTDLSGMPKSKKGNC